MKSKVVLSIVFLFAISMLSFTASHPMLPLGEKAPMIHYEMLGVDGENYTLESLNAENGLLVIFSCNTCPFVLAWEESYPQLSKLTKDNGIGMVLVNSNTMKRDNEDSMEAMKSHYKEANYSVPYVMDAENKLANAFGAKTTPHVYLFDKALNLVYRGSINNKFENKSKKADKFYLNRALEALSKGEKVNPADTREIGCSIKRV